MKKEIKISGMRCVSCASNIEKEVSKISGVDSAEVNFSKNLLVYKTEKKDFKEEIKKTIEKMGYKIGDKDEEKSVHRAGIRALWALAFSLPLMVTMALMYSGFHFPALKFIEATLAFVVVYIIGFETHLSALKSIKRFYANMDVLISIGTSAAFSLGVASFFVEVPVFFEVAAFIMAFQLLGRYLEVRARGKTSETLKSLLSLEAKTANIISNGREIEISIEEIKPGDVMVIRPGEKIPTDGRVIEGESIIDESMATGESVPVEKKPGDEIIGSTINREGFLKAKATKVGKETFLSQVIKMVEEAQNSRIPVQEFADKVTSHFVPVILAIGVITFFAWFFLDGWFIASVAAITVLIIACPCALGLATPTALTVGIGRGAERGVLFRKGEAIETMKKTKTIVLDKTGTLTKGMPVVTDIFPTSKENDILRFSASIEKGSEHPLAKAILKKAEEKDLELFEIKAFKALFGRGAEAEIKGERALIGRSLMLKEEGVDISSFEKEIDRLESEGKTVMILAVNQKALGIIAVADTLKDETRGVVKKLYEMGYRVVMLTGDNKRTANSIAFQAGIKDVVAEVLPGEKVDFIKSLQKGGFKVAMVGDGINDAPALTQADVGISIGTGTDIAIEAGDITLVRGNLNSLIDSINLSRETFKTIRQNLFWAFIYNVIAIPVASFGLLATMIGPVIAAVAMAFSSLSVVLNSLRLKRKKILSLD